MLAAQSEGRLVIFVGAGVSIGPPSNYPDFKGLIRKVAKDSGVRRTPKYESDDHFLGRLENAGVRVHELAKNFLTDPKSRPNPLHFSIIKLFDTSNTLRLVTTNFDLHFSTIIKEQFPKGLETYSAPALPVGRRFEGLVYIHGSVLGPADRLVLTDRDFGQAYLTEGWARRFLQDVYSRFTVLFIGYSHNDTVMTYLTRGLSPDNVRLFALTGKGTEERWQFLGITPISYALGKSPDKHKVLYSSIAGWAEIASMGSLDHEQKVRVALTASPPLIGTEDDDYLKSVVQDENKINFFMRNASDIEWLLWAEDRELLTPLFSRKTVQDPRIIVLAYWFARKYVLKHPEVALGVLERQGQILSQTLWYEVARSLHSINDPDSNSFSKWLTILIDQSTYEDNVKLLEYLFNKAAKAGSWPLALRLFEYLTRPHIKFDKSSSFFSSGHRDPTPTISKIYIRGSHHWLKNGWENTFKPHLKEIARDVVLLTSSNIRMAYDLSVCHGISNIGWDVLNFQKSAIEPHEQDHLNYAFNIVIDACRDSLEWLLVHNRSVAIFLIKEWILTPVPLLRRLAIYGMNLDKKKSPDLKLKWAVNHKLVSYNLVHHELFQMLQHVYPLSSKPVKKAFLEQARIATKEEIKEHPGDDPAMFWHGLFELLSWLDKASKVKCPLVRNRLIRLKKKYPTFKVSDHPDFTHWLGEVTWGAKSPITIEGLLEQPLEDSISLLLSFKEDSFSGPSRGGLMSILSTSVTQDPDWGLQLAKNLLKKRLKPDNVWSSILSGWSAADLNEKQWKDILNLIDKNAMLLEHEHVMTHVLERGISIEKHHLPYSLLPIAERIGNKLWNVVASKKKPPTTASTDWLQTAINEPGGVLTKFFLTAISIRRKHVGISWTIIPKNLKSQLGQIASGRSYASEMGRVLLVSHLHFLYACDAKWTMTKVLPLLSWKKNKKKAVQAWHGYLFWGKWYDEYLPDLLPLYEQGFTRLNKDLINVRERFVEHIASICVFSTRNTARGRWLNHFLRSVDSTDLREFAGSIKKMLWSLDQDKAEKAWRKWLDAYWEKRLSGKPVPLEKEEASKMAEWAPHMGCMFPEVVKKICRTQLELSVDSFIYHMLNEKNIPATYPKATVDLLLCLVRTSYEAMYDYVDLEDVIKELVNHSETHEILKQVLDYMSSKGSIIASKYNLELT